MYLILVHIVLCKLYRCGKKKKKNVLFVQDSSQTSCVGVYVNMLNEASKAWSQEPKVPFKYLGSYGEIYKEHTNHFIKYSVLKMYHRFSQ